MKAEELGLVEGEDFDLIFVYPKNVQDDLAPDQKKAIRKMIETINKE